MAAHALPPVRARPRPPERQDLRHEGHGDLVVLVPFMRASWFP